MHRFFFWWSAIFGPLCLIWAAFMATGMHWLFAGIGAGASAGHGWALKVHHDRIPPRIPPPSRHDLALREIDRLERELRIGAHAKTQAEFDREVEAAVRPFRYLLQNLALNLLALALTRSPRRRRYLMRHGLPGTGSSGTVRRGRLSEAQLIGQAHARMIRAMLGDPRE